MAFFLSVRPLPWSFVRRMQYAPTRIIENRPRIGFVFRGVAEKGAGRGLCEKWGRRASIIIRRLLPLRARRRMGPIIASAHAFIILVAPWEDDGYYMDLFWDNVISLTDNFMARGITVIIEYVIFEEQLKKIAEILKSIGNAR